MICSVPDCPPREVRIIRGMCEAHYRRMKRDGDPTAGGPLRGFGGITLCNVDGCADPVVGFGWCDFHYRRYRRYGDPLAGPRRRGRDPIERFWAKVDKSGNHDGCWVWVGSLDQQGYGRVAGTQFTGERRALHAHRVSFMLSNPGIDIAGKVVMHRCDNPPCVNPAHLVLGSQADNIRDMAQKGRWRNHCAAGYAHQMPGGTTALEVKRRR